MNDCLAGLMLKLEGEIGAERASLLRREAARRRISLVALLAEAVVDYAGRLAEADAGRLEIEAERARGVERFHGLNRIEQSLKGASHGITE